MATFVGFTGTPIERDDKNTIHVFGGYADVYDIRQAVEDGATTPLYYESRIVKLTVDDAGAAAAEAELEKAAEADASGDVQENVRVPLEALVGAQERIDRLSAFIVEHWEKRRTRMYPEIEGPGKGLIVCATREIAANLYRQILELRPNWHSDAIDGGRIKVVYSGTASDQPPISDHVARHARPVPGWIMLRC